MATETWHRRVLEHRSALLAGLTTVVISIGGIVEIVPMYTVKQAPTVDIAPYTPLQVAGRDIYVREGCYNCHSQMIRPMRAETVRYGPWTRAEEYTWDRPFQLGSRRIGPDLQRVGGKYPDAWHYEHLRDPRSTSPGSIMPSYSWLLEDTVDPADIQASIGALATLGTPYPDTSEAWVTASMAEEAGAIVSRLATTNIQTTPDKEVVALIAYLQRLGTDGKRLFAEAP
jgi:cytochrome c oxidase cbb3-type subunit I/II